VQQQLSAHNRTLTNCFGRKRKYYGRWDDSLFKEAYSFIPQSTVADKINRHGMLPIWRDQETFQNVELLNQVHDSIVFQIPLSIGLAEHEKLLRKIKRLLEQPIEWLGTSFVIPAEFEVGTCLGALKKLDFKQELSKQLEEIK